MNAPMGYTVAAKPLRVLIMHQNFPGQFRHIAASLATNPGVEVIGLGRDGAPGMPGIRWYKYRTQRQVSNEAHRYTRQMEAAVLHGQAVARTLIKIKQTGFVPDVVLAHPGWGETLYLREIFPDARRIYFCEWYYSTEGADFGFDSEFPVTLDDRLRITTWNALHLLNLEQCDTAISPTQWQKNRHPELYLPRIDVIHEGIDTDQLSLDQTAQLILPNGKKLHAGQPIVTYVARNLEPYRGFHTFMRALPRLLYHHPDCQVVIIGGDGISYGGRPADAPNWREKLLREVKIDRNRVHFLGRVPYNIYKKALQVSAAHVYLTYPFVLSWSMLEAMASGCLVIGSDTAPVREVICHGENGLLTDFFDHERLADQIAEALYLPEKFSSMRRQAMVDMRQHYGLQVGIAAYTQLVTGTASPTKLQSILPEDSQPWSAHRLFATGGEFYSSLKGACEKHV